jgi:hypothetical protein
VRTALETASVDTRLDADMLQHVLRPGVLGRPPTVHLLGENGEGLLHRFGHGQRAADSVFVDGRGYGHARSPSMLSTVFFKFWSIMFQFSSE